MLKLITWLYVLFMEGTGTCSLCIIIHYNFPSINIFLFIFFYFSLFRFTTYVSQTKPIVDHYAKESKVKTIEANRGVDEVSVAKIGSMEPNYSML